MSLRGPVLQADTCKDWAKVTIVSTIYLFTMFSIICNIISVVADCKREGVEFAKKEMSKSISEVMNFFSLAKCVNINKADGKSINVMGKPSI